MTQTHHFTVEVSVHLTDEELSEYREETKEKLIEQIDDGNYSVDNFYI